MKQNSYKSRVLQRKVMDHLRSEHHKGVQIVYYIPLSETLKVSVGKLRTMLMPIGGGSHGIRLDGEMFHGYRNPSRRPVEG
jgi:hypothetical protein